MGKKIEMLGQQFGKWLILPVPALSKNKNLYYLCRCKCGTEKLVLGSSLRKGASRGCQPCQNSRHGLLKNGVPRSYKSWNSMTRRCINPKSEKWHLYGGRGIKVCSRWLKFENFLMDMGEPPEKYQLDRIDSDGDYEPSNCRWVSPKENSNNRRVSLINRHKYDIIPLNRACSYCLCVNCINERSKQKCDNIQ